MDTPASDVPADDAPKLPARGGWFWVGVGGGLGLIRPAPGTWGSLLGLPLGWGLSLLPWWLAAVCWAALTAVAWASCGPVCRALGSKDPGPFVADEYAALAGVFVVVPFGWLSAALAFTFFRLFDIWKPWPVRTFDRMGGTAGVMLDDVAAAGYTLAVLWLLGAA